MEIFCTNENDSVVKISRPPSRKRLNPHQKEEKEKEIKKKIVFE